MNKKEEKYLNSERYNKPNYGALSRVDQIATNADDATAVPANIETKTSDATAVPARFANLPPELTHKVFEFLSGKGVVPLLATSKKHRESVLLSHGLFRQMIYRKSDVYRNHLKKLPEDIDSNKKKMSDFAVGLYSGLFLCSCLFIGISVLFAWFSGPGKEETLEDAIEAKIALPLVFGFTVGVFLLGGNIRLLGLVINLINMNRKFERYQEKFNFLEDMRQVLLASEESTGSPESASTPTANESERISTPVSPYR